MICTSKIDCAFQEDRGAIWRLSRVGSAYVKACETIGNATEFKDLKSDKKNKKMFRNLLFLPPRVVIDFLSMSSRDLGDLAHSTKLVSKKNQK